MGLLVDGAVHVFGWPIQLGEYVIAMLKWPKTGLTREEVEKSAHEAVERLYAARLQAGHVIEMRQEPGESDEAFHTRLGAKLQAHIESKRGGDRAANSTNGT